jgi:hypothetical protein
VNKENCIGCYYDDYNRGLGGAKQCWSFESAKLVDRLEVHIDEIPPHKNEYQKLPSCYQRQRYIYVERGREK